MMYPPEFTGGSNFDDMASDAQEFAKLAEHMLELVHLDIVKTNGNKHVLCFIAAGLIEATESIQEYMSNEVEKN